MKEKEITGKDIETAVKEYVQSYANGYRDTPARIADPVIEDICRKVMKDLIEKIGDLTPPHFSSHLSRMRGWNPGGNVN